MRLDTLNFCSHIRAWRERRKSLNRLTEAVKRIGGKELLYVINRPDKLFNAVFALNAWQGEQSRSGRGSDLDNTVAIRTALPKLLEKLEIKILLDLPCGDFNWMQRTKLNLDLYIGADCVGDLIVQNRERYSAPKRQFIVCDIVRDPLPTADLLLCRDLLVHLSYVDIHRALRNIRHSGTRWLLTTQFIAPERTNSDILTGDWRPLNFCHPPFNLPKPRILIDECYTAEDGRWRDKHLALWAVDDLL